MPRNVDLRRQIICRRDRVPGPDFGCELRIDARLDRGHRPDVHRFDAELGVDVDFGCELRIDARLNRGHRSDVHRFDAELGVDVDFDCELRIDARLNRGHPPV